jgi:hypothetical protein
VGSGAAVEVQMVGREVPCASSARKMEWAMRAIKGEVRSMRVCCLL